MRGFNATGHALTASIALTMLSGCGGISQMAPAPLAQVGTGSSSTQQQDFQNGRLNSFLAMHGGIVSGHGVTTPSFMDPRAVGKPLLFVANNNVDIYLQGGKNKVVGQITGANAIDLATDLAGDLYAVDFNFGVRIYAPPYTNGPKLTFPAGRGPVGVAVSRQGTVAVETCTIPSGSQCGDGVLFFAADSTTPCATVLANASVFPNGLQYGAAFDDKENLYVGGGGSVFGKIDGGCNAKKIKTLTITNTIAYSGGVRVDKADRIAILVETNENAVAIDTYDPPKGGSLGSPVSTTPLTNSGNPAGTFAFRASGRGLWAPYEGVGQSYEPGTSEYVYPAGGAPEKTVLGPPESVDYAVAVTPVLVP